MQLTRLQIQNITCFENIDLEFTTTESGPPPWIVFVGENGTGKSTLLQMLGVVLTGTKNTTILSGNVDWNILTRKATKEKKYPNRATVSILDKKSNKFDHDVIILDGGSIAEEHDSYYYNRKDLFAAGYSSWGRAMPGGRLSLRASLMPSIPETHEAYRFSTLFSAESILVNASDWIRRLFNLKNNPNIDKEEEDKRQKYYDAICTSLCDALPDVDKIFVDTEDYVQFQCNNTFIRAEQFSDGYRGMLSWAVDLMKRLYDAFPESSNPLHEQGIVLLDEIDMHLHPQWQRRVVEDIRKIFPKIQFIVTTHSPFIIQDMRETDHIVLLERQSDGSVSAREDSQSLQQWSADQILSAYFGFPEGTYNDRVIKDERRYQELVQQQVSGTLTEEQKQEIAALKQKLDAAPKGDTLSERELYNAADIIIDALHARREQRRPSRIKENGE